MCQCCHTISIDNNDSKIKIGLATLVPFFYFQLNKKIAAIIFYMTAQILQSLYIINNHIVGIQ